MSTLYVLGGVAALCVAWAIGHIDGAHAERKRWESLRGLKFPTESTTTEEKRT